MSWSPTDRRCANCTYWPLSPYDQNRWERNDELTRPSGEAGNDQSACRRHAPPWQATHASDWCGDFIVRDGLGSKRG